MAQATLRAWAEESREDQIGAVMEDPSILDYLNVVLDHQRELQRAVDDALLVFVDTKWEESYRHLYSIGLRAESSFLPERVFRKGRYVCEECGYSDGHAESCSAVSSPATEGDGARREFDPSDSPSVLDSSIDIEGAEAGWTGAPDPATHPYPQGYPDHLTADAHDWEPPPFLCDHEHPCGE